MSESSGFFVSQGGDRKYTPDWLAKYIKALVTTGVYSDECGVTAGTGMSVSVAAGRAWIEGYLYLLDTAKTLTIANADASNERRDIVVLRLDLTARTITVQVVTGTPAAQPVAPAITRNADVYELELAEISVPAGTSSITQALITDKRLDDTVCGITVSAVQHISTASYLEQMLAAMEERGAVTAKVRLLNLGDQFIAQGSIAQLRRSVGIDAQGIIAAVREVCHG